MNTQDDLLNEMKKAKIKMDRRSLTKNEFFQAILDLGPSFITIQHRNYLFFLEITEWNSYKISPFYYKLSKNKKYIKLT